MLISDWSSDLCASDRVLHRCIADARFPNAPVEPEIYSRSPSPWGALSRTWDRASRSCAGDERRTVSAVQYAKVVYEPLLSHGARDTEHRSRAGEYAELKGLVGACRGQGGEIGREWTR